LRRIIFSTALCLLLLSCGGSGGEAGGTEVTVFAATSLTGAFGRIGAAFEKSHPGTSVTFNFLTSSDLATQITEGAHADVFASADQDNMQKVSSAVASPPSVFARNRLEIVVRPGNPKGITSVGDLANDGLVVSLCNSECPAGKYAAELFQKDGVVVHADSLESDVKGVVTRVQLGEADAGICYATDVRAAGDAVEGVPIPGAENIVATYPIAVMDGAPPAAREFVDLVTSPAGAKILRSYGFLGP
jgi:molybdate transport system substrate-binding protein